MTVDSSQLIAFWIPVASIVLSTILGLIKIWEVCFKDRVRLDTTYSWTSLEGEPDSVVVVNLSAAPLMVANWRLYWHSPHAGEEKRCDVTPDEGGWRFRIEPHQYHEIQFTEQYKFDWSGLAKRYDELVLELEVFGESKPRRLSITSKAHHIWG